LAAEAALSGRVTQPGRGDGLIACFMSLTCPALLPPTKKERSPELLEKKQLRSGNHQRIPFHLAHRQGWQEGVAPIRKGKGRRWQLAGAEAPEKHRSMRDPVVREECYVQYIQPAARASSLQTGISTADCRAPSSRFLAGTSAVPTKCSYRR